MFHAITLRVYCSSSQGRKRVKTVPERFAASEERTRRLPLWRWTISWVIQRPRPVPLRPLVVKKGSKMRD
jgi:hypothetical protein